VRTLLTYNTKERNGNYLFSTSKHPKYRTKQCRTKDENFVQESLHLQAILQDKSDEILSDIVLSDKVCGNNKTHSPSLCDYC